MFKRSVLTCTAFILILFTAGCGNEAPKPSESPVVAQDIFLGADDAEIEPGLTMPADSGDSAFQEQALTDEKEYLQKVIDRLNDKIANLQWLKDSYSQENPADLMTKLAECDALIADAQNELTSLQSRLTQNEQNVNALCDEEPSNAPDISQPPLETAPDSQPVAPEDPAAVS